MGDQTQPQQKNPEEQVEELPSYAVSETERQHIPPNYLAATHASWSGSPSDGKQRANLALKWGVTPSSVGPTAQEPPPDHPVHQIPLETQEKWRKKGINPVLKAEMDHAMSQNKSRLGKFWVQAGLGSGLGFNSAGGL